ncbi:MAG TPA: hypothetical protein VEL76_20820 [Gemmataceae bacterium]|nr:hypothetical protein [Gemmataceae bacterium]
MRAGHKMVLTVSVACLSVTMVFGQGFPFGGGGGVTNPQTLLQRKDVREELKMTDEQLAKLPEAQWKIIGEILDAKQVKRLRQIVLQQQGANAFTDAKVAAELKLTDAQKTSIKEALDSSTARTKELFQDLKGGGGFKGLQEKMTEIRKETMEKITAVLKTDQKRTWNDMVGEEFKLEQKGFGKGGFDFKGKDKGKGKKKDTQ